MDSLVFFVFLVSISRLEVTYSTPVMSLSRSNQPPVRIPLHIQSLVPGLPIYIHPPVVCQTHMFIQVQPLSSVPICLTTFCVPLTRVLNP